MEPTGPNAQQIEYWNQQGTVWVAAKPVLDGLIEPLGRIALERAAPAMGERAIDVGCGTGQTALELGRRVSASGRVLAIDISLPMLSLAREQARAAGLEQVRFENADAQTHAFEPAGFDLVFSRFGVMFFADPVAAFANLLRALRPGGRLAFVCWQELGKNPWMLEPVLAIAKHVTLPPPSEPGAPGPFAFADAERVRGILESAGFEAVEFEPLAELLVLGAGAGLDGAVAQAMRIGPAGAALRDASDDVRAAAAASVREALAPHAGPDGVRLPSASWIVLARRGV